MKLRQCSNCKTPVSLANHIREFVCSVCGLKQSATLQDLRARVSLVRTLKKKQPAPVRGVMDFGRGSFSKVSAPRSQQCAYSCGQTIEKGQEVYARVLMSRGRPAGQTRIIDLEDHYVRWFEEVAHKYAMKVADKVPGMRQYFEGTRRG